MIEFTDNLGRIINIEEDGDDIIASHDNREIGKFTIYPPDPIDQISTLPARIDQMHIDDEFQKAGIGTKMLEHAHDINGRLIPPPRDNGVGGQNALTPAGECLIKKGIKKKWVFPFD